MINSEETRLKVSIICGDNDVFSRLIEIVNILTCNDEVIRSAIMHNRLGMLEVLVNLGADIHFNNEEPLLIAVVMDKIEFIEYLLSIGADIKAVEKLGYTWDPETRTVGIKTYGFNDFKNSISSVGKRFRSLIF